MLIRFADTLGRLQDDPDAFVRLPQREDLLCSAFVEPQSGDVIIVDRLPTQETSQLPHAALITLIRHVKKLITIARDEPLVIRLPRIHSSMFAEAKMQRLIYEALSDKTDSDASTNAAIILTA